MDACMCIEQAPSDICENWRCWLLYLTMRERERERAKERARIPVCPIWRMNSANSWRIIWYFVALVTLYENERKRVRFDLIQSNWFTLKAWAKWKLSSLSSLETNMYIQSFLWILYSFSCYSFRFFVCARCAQQMRTIEWNGYGVYGYVHVYLCAYIGSHLNSMRID